ncbi:MAG: hypothetical protein ABSD27_01560 [Bryobacteraceae bacterium]|jgi:hypothetical protein
MRHLAVLCLAASGAFAANFLTGQAARAVIGQPYFTAQTPTSSDTVLGGVGGLAYANGMLVVTDANRMSAGPINHRVLIYRNLQQQLPGPTDAPPQGARCPVCVGQADVVLGQADFTASDPSLSQSGLRLPTAVATDGTRLAVADTDNNRVLIWNTIPQSNNTPADIVLGQPDFKTSTPNSGSGDVRIPSARSMRGPEGVWIQGNKLFVADGQNHRVLIWNTFPTQSSQPADLVLGQPNLSTLIEPDMTKASQTAKATTLVNPVGVTSDGVRLFVADLGNNRVLIWNTIPTQNEAPADVAVGQPDLNSNIANNSSAVVSTDAKTGITISKSVLCASNGTDTNGNPAFPLRCGATLSFPRFALSDGTRLFIADGGNDRVLVFNSIPTQSGAKADVVLGQVNDTVIATSDDSSSADITRRAAADAVRTPASLAWDGTNLYVSEPFSRRVLVFSPGSSAALTPVLNAASLVVYSTGSVTLSGTVKTGVQITITIAGTDYKYTLKDEDDSLARVSIALAAVINADAGDPLVLAVPFFALNQVELVARAGGEEGNNIVISAASSDTSITTTTAVMSGGGTAAKLAAGTLITIFGDQLSDQTAAAPEGADPLPTQLGGVEAYFDGRRVPLLYVSPNQVNAQLPFELSDSTSTSGYVRTTHADGTVSVSTAVGVLLIPANPGIFTYGGSDPRPAVAFHYSSQATATVDLEGIPVANDTATITIRDRNYTYTVQTNDTLVTVRDGLIAAINANGGDPEVEAFAGAQWVRVRLRARVAGADGNGIPISTATTGSGTIAAAYNSVLTGANIAGAPVTVDNPVVPGETFVVYAPGLGQVVSSGSGRSPSSGSGTMPTTWTAPTDPDPATTAIVTGAGYPGPELNTPSIFVSAMAGGKTANVLSAALKPGAIGLYQVELELNSDLPTNPSTVVTISQDIYVSNQVTIPVLNPSSQ